MATTIKVDDSTLVQLLKNHEGFVSKTMPELVRKYSRIACVELANRTQPFSVGAKSEGAKKLGEDAVKIGITGVIPEKAYFQFIVDSTSNDTLRERLQGYVASGQWKKFAEVMVSVGMWKEAKVISGREIGTIHKQHRSKSTGRALSTKGKMYLAKSGPDAYIKKIQKRVGLSKSGWADAARKIGGVKGDGARGIPAFAKAKRHKSAGGITDRTKDKTNPRVDMQNDTPWVSRICPRSEQLIALQIARDKMIKEADMRLKSAAKNKFEESTQ